MKDDSIDAGANSHSPDSSGITLLKRISGEDRAEELLYEADVRTVWRFLAEPFEIDGSNLEDLVVATLWAEIALSQDDLAEGLQVLEGVWRLDLSVAAVRSLVLCVLLAGYLVLRGAPDLDIAVLSAVLPYFASIERVELTDSDTRLLLLLTRNSEILQARDTGEMYRHAPRSLRRRINEREFAEYIDRLTRAGYASEHDGEITIRQHPRFKIEFH